MAKTTDPNIFLVKPTYVSREIGPDNKKRRPRVWYLNQLQRPQLKTLLEVGGAQTFTTKGNPEQGKAPRTVHVVAVADVTPGTKHTIKLADGKTRRVTIPVVTQS